MSVARRISFQLAMDLAQVSFPDLAAQLISALQQLGYSAVEVSLQALSTAQQNGVMWFGVALSAPDSTIDVDLGMAVVNAALALNYDVCASAPTLYASPLVYGATPFPVQPRLRASL